MSTDGRGTQKYATKKPHVDHRDTGLKEESIPVVSTTQSFEKEYRNKIELVAKFPG